MMDSSGEISPGPTSVSVAMPEGPASPIERAPFSRQVLASVMVVVVGLAIFFALSRRPAPAPDNLPPPGAGDATTDAVTVTARGKKELQIKTEVARLATPDSTLATTGLVSLPADRQTVVSPRLSGRIQKVFVTVGQHVDAGQILATMDSVDAANAQTAAVENADKYQLAKSELDRQQRLFRLGTPEVSSAEAALKAARENERFTKTALAKIREQAAIGGFTQQPLADAQTAAVQGQSDLATAKTAMAASSGSRGRATPIRDLGSSADARLACTMVFSAPVVSAPRATGARAWLTVRPQGDGVYGALQIAGESRAERRARVRVKAASSTTFATRALWASRHACL